MIKLNSYYSSVHSGKVFVNSKAIDISERSKGPDDFILNKERKDKRYLSVKGFLTVNVQTMKKKRSYNQ